MLRWWRIPSCYKENEILHATKNVTARKQDECIRVTESRSSRYSPNRSVVWPVYRCKHFKGCISNTTYGEWLWLSRKICFLILAWHIIKFRCVKRITIKRRLSHIVEVFTNIHDNLQSVNLKLKAKKCNFFRQEVSFLGPIVSENYIKTVPSKTEADKNWIKPQTVTELRSFLWLTAYYRRFIQYFARIAKCLHVLTGKNKE